MTIEHQDSEIIIINPYVWNGVPDGIYIKNYHTGWCMSTVGNNYKVMLDRTNYNLIEMSNEYYEAKYAALEPSLVGDVLLLGMGFAILDNYLSTGSSWKWIERNSWLVANLIPTNGTVHQGDAEDEDFIATLGTFDTILVDFRKTKLNNYDQFLNPGGSILEFKL